MTPQPRPGTSVRRRRVPGQGRLLGAAAMMLVGAFLPWLYTPVGTVSGMRGAGVWTFYASMLALTGGLVPSRMLAAAQGAVCAVVALGLSLWQVLHVLRLTGTEGWSPGPGLVMTAAAGVLCAVAARQLYAARPPAGRT